MFLKSADADIFVQDYGAGPRTLVAHGGWVGSGELWAPVFERLSRSWRVATYDHRGCGATISRAPAITFDLLVDDLFRILDHLEIDQCVLAGESAGAAVVLEAALRQPERFPGLVIVDGRYVGTRTPALDRTLQGCRVDFPATMAAFVDACVPEEDCAAERAWGRQIVMRSTASMAIELMMCMETIDIESRLPQIRAKTLVLHGDRDVIVPLSSAEKLASLIPDAKLVVAAGAGHVPTVTRPRWVADEIDAFFPAPA